METVNRDEADLTFKATFSLDTLAEQEQQTLHTYEPSGLPRFCTRGVWKEHKTLLYRLALFVFFTLLITLFETVFPGKTGLLSQLFGAFANSNVTNGIGGK